MEKQFNLYRQNEKGEIVVKTVSRGMYADKDSYQEALDHFSAEGFYDTYEEAKEENKPSIPKTVNNDNKSSKFKF